MEQMIIIAFHAILWTIIDYYDELIILVNALQDIMNP